MGRNNVLILGAGRGQMDLISAAVKYHLNPIIASIKGDYPGLKMGIESYNVDISDPSKVLELAKKKDVIGIATACLDTGIPSLGYVCTQMNLPGLTTEAAACCNHKLLMKDILIEKGVNTAKYREVSSELELYAVVNEFGLPIIIKPVDLQGSRGINIVKSERDLIPSYRRTMSETKKSFCIVEEFLEGCEFGAQAFIADGEVLFVLPCGDIVFKGTTNIPVGHYVPLDLEPQILQKTNEQVKMAISAIGLNNCAVNVDLICRDKEVYIIELTGRIGANCLPQLTSIYYGIDIYKMILDVAIGRNPRRYFSENKQAPCAGYAKMIFSKQSGILKEIVNHNEKNDRIMEVKFFVEPGDKINAFSNSKDCIGEIVVKGNSVEECESLINNVMKNLEIKVENTYE